jgi:hypothetical protein
MEQELLLTGCVVWPIIPLASSATNGYSRISERQVSGENRFITHVIFLAGFSLLRIIHLAE